MRWSEDFWHYLPLPWQRSSASVRVVAFWTGAFDMEGNLQDLCQKILQAGALGMRKNFFGRAHSSISLPSAMKSTRFGDLRQSPSRA